MKHTNASFERPYFCSEGKLIGWEDSFETKQESPTEKKTVGAITSLTASRGLPTSMELYLEGLTLVSKLKVAMQHSKRIKKTFKR